VLRLKYGRSYAWLFAIFVVVFLGGNALCSANGYRLWGVLTMPATITIVLLSELWSGVALNSMWRASYLKETDKWQYLAVLAWHTVGVVLFSLVAYIVIRV
jgi:hypothetical protein